MLATSTTTSRSAIGACSGEGGEMLAPVGKCIPERTQLLRVRARKDCAKANDHRKRYVSL
jgi:hypothetical protein